VLSGGGLGGRCGGGGGGGPFGGGGGVGARNGGGNGGGGDGLGGGGLKKVPSEARAAVMVVVGCVVLMTALTTTAEVAIPTSSERNGLHKGVRSIAAASAHDWALGSKGSCRQPFTSRAIDAAYSIDGIVLPTLSLERSTVKSTGALCLCA